MKKSLLSLVFVIVFLLFGGIKAAAIEITVKGYSKYDELTLKTGNYYVVNFKFMYKDDMSMLNMFDRNGIMHYELINEETIDTVLSEVGLRIDSGLRNILLNPQSGDYTGSYFFFYIDTPLTYRKGDSFYGDVYWLEIDEGPIITDKRYHILNYDDGITLEMLKKRYTANDNYDGDLTHQIDFDSDYPNNYSEVKIGEYYITATVRDSSGNTSSVTNPIKVVDLTAPVFSGKASYILEYGEEFSFEEVLAGLSCYDNYEKAISSTKWLIEDNKEFNPNILEPQEFVIYYLDGSGNRGEIRVVIDINDTKAPVITISDLVEISESNLLTEEKLIQLLVNSNYIPSNYKNVSIDSEYFNNALAGNTYDALCELTLEDGSMSYYRFQIAVVKKQDYGEPKVNWLTPTLIIITVLALGGGITAFVINKRKKTGIS